jgi:hypothetical protein
MAKLSQEIRATLSQQKEKLLDLVDEAKSLEFILWTVFAKIKRQYQLTEIAEQARTKLSQLSTLHLRIAEVQPPYL